MTITVAGYPRSGTVWVARLLGDALDYPVTGLKGGRGTIAAEGLDRKGNGRVIHAHILPDHRLSNQGKVVLVVRDPRDVAVSAAAFWEWTLEETLDKMIDGPGPVELPPWQDYTDAWRAVNVPTVLYEDLQVCPQLVLEKLLEQLGEHPRRPLHRVIWRQSFAVKRYEIEQNGDGYPFGREAQLQHLRHGTSGEWEQRLSPTMKQRALDVWGDYLVWLDY